MNLSELKDDDGMQKLVLSTGAIVAGLLLKEALKGGYKYVFKEAPPSETSDEKVKLSRLLLWAAASGVTVSVMKTLLKRYSHRAIKANN